MVQVPHMDYVILSTKAKRKGLGHTRLDLRYAVLLAVLIALSACVSAPTAGVNRHEVFAETSAVVLPFKVLVSEKSRTVYEGIVLPPKDYSHHVGPGLQGALSQAVLDLVHKSRMEADKQDQFPAGDVFEHAFQKASFSGPENRPIMTVELVQCQPRLYLLGETRIGPRD